MMELLCEKNPTKLKPQVYKEKGYIVSVSMCVRPREWLVKGLREDNFRNALFQW